MSDAISDLKTKVDQACAHMRSQENKIDHLSIAVDWLRHHAMREDAPSIPDHVLIAIGFAQDRAADVRNRGPFHEAKIIPLAPRDLRADSASAGS